MLIENGELKKVTNADIKDDTFIFPKEVTVIGEYAFWGCKNKNLTSIEIPDSVTAISANVFLRLQKEK